MDEKTVKQNLKLVFLKETEVEKALIIKLDAYSLENEVKGALDEAKDFLMKSMGSFEEVYVNIEDKFYKIIPNRNEDNIIIEEITMIR